LEACEIVKRKTQEVLISKTYKEHERHGPLRRGTGKGMAESLRVQNIGVNTYEMRPVGIAETYAVPLEEGHKSPINGGARETGYFKMGRRLAQPALRRLFKDAVKQITR
jgi:hypothetical protein